MDSSLYFNGKKFISASRAGEITGYTSDYIGQLCRAKKINSKIVGRTRYVLESDVVSYGESFSKESKSKKSLNPEKNKYSILSKKTGKNLKKISISNLSNNNSKNKSSKIYPELDKTTFNTYQYLGYKKDDKSRLS